jgi:hypothetical protein
MKIVYGTMLVTTMVLTIYLVVSIGNIIPAIKQNVTDSQKAIAPLQAQLDKQQEMLTLLQTDVTAFRKEVNEPIKKAESRKAAIQSVRGALAKVEEADAMRKAANLTKAMEILLSSKDPLWKAGDAFPSEQTVFRGLMTPIDATISKWKSGDGNVDTAQISTSIKTILEKISREQ